MIKKMTDYLKSERPTFPQNAIIHPAWHYRYIGPGPHLKGQECWGCRSLTTGKRIWSGGPGPRNALVWFVTVGFVVVPGRSTLRKIKETNYG